MTAGHLGVNKTLSRVRECFYWPWSVLMWRIGVGSVSSVLRGKIRQNPTKRRWSYTMWVPQWRELRSTSWDRCPWLKRGNRYILVIVDYFTKWTEAFAIPDHEAETVAKKLVHEFICRLGVPIQLHSDQGRNFESALFSEMTKLLGILYEFYMNVSIRPSEIC